MGDGDGNTALLEDDADETALLEGSGGVVVLLDQDNEETALVEDSGEDTVLLDEDDEDIALPGDDNEEIALLEDGNGDSALLEDEDLVLDVEVPLDRELELELATGVIRLALQLFEKPALLVKPADFI